VQPPTRLCLRESTSAPWSTPRVARYIHVALSISPSSSGSPETIVGKERRAKHIVIGGEFHRLRQAGRLVAWDIGSKLWRIAEHKRTGAGQIHPNLVDQDAVGQADRLPRRYGDAACSELAKLRPVRWLGTGVEKVNWLWERPLRLLLEFRWPLLRLRCPVPLFAPC
jgi:hypothetical protein